MLRARTRLELRMKHPIPVFCLLLPVSAMAQISIAVSAWTPIQLAASNGTLPNSVTQPPGPLPAGLTTFQAQAPGGTNSALFQSDASATAVAVDWTLGHFVAVTGNGSASVAQNELVIQLTAPTVTPGRLFVTHTDATPAGAPQPRADVDVGNDGTLDYVNGLATGPINPLVVGPQPLQIRVIMATDLAVPGTTNSELRLRFLPDNDLDVVLAAIGCGPFAAAVVPTFAASGVRITNQVPTAAPKVMVLGLTTQPLLLPSTGAQPCLLLPNPDAVLWWPAFAFLDVALPAAVRPVTFWLQPVELAGSSLLTGAAHRVDAH